MGLTLGKLPVRWVETEKVPILMANQFLVQIDVASDRPDQIVLAIGQVTSPPVLGTIEEKRTQLEELSQVPVQTLARYSVTPARLVELIKLLEGVQRAFDASEPDEEAAS